MSLLDIFLKGKYNVGLGLSNYFDLPKTGIHLANTKEEILNSKKAINDVVTNANAANVLRERNSSLINNSVYNFCKFMLMDLGLDTTIYSAESFTELMNIKQLPEISNILQAYLNYIYSQNKINVVLNMLEPNDFFNLMNEGKMLINRPWETIEEYNQTTSQSQYNDKYTFRMYGDDTTTGFVAFYSNEKFNLTNVDEIEFDFDVTHDGGLTPRLYLGVYINNTHPTKAFNANFYDGSVQSSDLRKTVSVDVSSLTGEHYLKICMYDDYSTDDADLYMNMYNIRFKKN